MVMRSTSDSTVVWLVDFGVEAEKESWPIDRVELGAEGGREGGGGAKPASAARSCA